MRQVISEEGDKRFDTKVHIRNDKGKIVDVRPYKMVMNRETGTYFVCKKTGRRYYANGEEIPAPKKVEDLAPPAGGAPGLQPEEKAAKPAPQGKVSKPFQPPKAAETPSQEPAGP